MRRLSAALLACTLAACRRAPPVIEINEDENGVALSFIEAGNPRASGQFLSGFHDVEFGNLRWTKRRFSLVLEPPPGAGPAMLILRFVMPEPLIARRHAVTLAAAVDGLPLQPERYAAASEDCTYSREVPESVLVAGPVKVDFSLDRYLAVGEVENRELGIAVFSAALRRAPAPAGR